MKIAFGFLLFSIALSTVQSGSNPITNERQRRHSWPLFDPKDKDAPVEKNTPSGPKEPKMIPLRRVEGEDLY